MPPPSREQDAADAAGEIAAYALIRAWMADDSDTGMLMIKQHHVPPEAAVFVMSLVKAASRRCCPLRAIRWNGALAVLDQWLENASERGHAVTTAQHELGKLDDAAAALIQATITDDQWTVERMAALAEDAPGGYVYFALLVTRVAGALLVEASGSKAQAAAVVNEWVRESVKIRTRKAT